MASQVLNRTTLGRFAVGLLATATSVLGAPSAAEAAPPSNDTFASRTVISTIPFGDNTSTAEATMDPGEPRPSCGDLHGNSVWYEYTASTAQPLQADTLGSDYDTIVSVWSGSSLTNLVEIACNDDTRDWLNSMVVFDPTPGTSYLIQVTGFADAGNLTFRLGEPTFASLSGTVRGESGEPLQDICVDVFSPALDDYVGFAMTDTAGDYLVTGLDDGTYQVEFSDWCDERTDHAAEWFDNQPSHDTAAMLAVAAPGSVTGIDAVLSPLRLSVATAGTGSGTVRSDHPGIVCGTDCAEVYEYGTSVTLSPTPDLSSFFAGWTGCDATEGENCIVFVDAPRTVEARFELDLVAPETTITGAPTNPSPPDATFFFRSSEPNSTFECSLDGAVFSSCSSPRTYTGMPDGEHRFAVRATDVAGNTDASPASYTWTVDSSLVDSTPPETRITSGPEGAVASKSATFAFASSEPDSTFACSLDDSPFSSCTSPKTYDGLTEGRHTFRVRATDGAGNVDPSPATRTWVVDADGPQMALQRPHAGLWINDQRVTIGGPAIIVVGYVTVEVAAADPQTGISQFRFEVNGTPVKASEISHQGDAFRFTFRPSAVGHYNISAHATNGSGVVSSVRIPIEGIPAG